MRTHLILPDTQVKPGVPTDHLTWIGQHIVEKYWGQDLAVIHLGDHWDFPSLSSYDKGKRQMEGRRYLADVEAGNEAMLRLNAPLEMRNAHKRSLKEKQWWPERYLLRGNHENRMQRAIDTDPEMLDGLMDEGNLIAPGWVVVPFLEPLWLDGICYAHYFVNKANGRPLSGTIDNRLKTLGHSFVQGHIPGLSYGNRPVFTPEGWTQQLGIIAGSCYTHRESYQGPQGNSYWRGIVVLHEVENGSADVMTVSLNYLCRRHAGMTLDMWEVA